MIYVIKAARLSRSDLGIGFAFHLLPPLRPKLGLISWHRNVRVQLHNTVLSFYGLNLRARLVKVIPSPDVGRKGDHAACLDSNEGRRSHTMHYSSRAALRQYLP